MKKKHMGSRLNNFLKEEGLLQDSKSVAAQKILSMPEPQTEQMSVEQFESRAQSLEKLIEQAQKLKLRYE